MDKELELKNRVAEIERLIDADERATFAKEKASKAFWAAINKFISEDIDGYKRWENGEL